MKNPLERYRDLELRLAHVRWMHEGYESEEEDAVLDEMDHVWGELSAAERERLDAEPPRTLLRHGRATRARRRLIDVDPQKEPGAPPRRVVDAA